MRIAFISSRMPFDGDSLETKGIGGSESALINITRSWKKNNPKDEVIVYNNNSGKRTDYNGIIYKNIYDFYSEIRTAKLDVLVSLREPKVFKQQFLDVKVKVLWSQDIGNEPELIDLQENKYNIENIDIIFVNSQFSLNNLRECFPNSDVRVLLNGYNSEFVYENIEKENIAIYTSTPFRGLNLLSDFWPIIYDKCLEHNIKPELKVFSGMSLYHQGDGNFLELYDKLKNQVGVTFHEPIPQKELFKELQKSLVMLYPNTWLESSCMATIEATANNVWVITSDYGALNEQIKNGETGYIIKENQNSIEYKEKFIDYAVSAFMNRPTTTRKYINSWNVQAEKMRNIILEKL